LAAMGVRDCPRGGRALEPSGGPPGWFT
jgi:hypothetical protein